MATEIISLWGGLRGKISRRPDGFQVSADFGDWGIWYVGQDPYRLAQAFHRACRRIILRRLPPFLAPPPARLTM